MTTVLSELLTMMLMLILTQSWILGVLGDPLTLDQFLEERSVILEQESGMFLGSNLQLSVSEQFANQKLMAAKREELAKFADPGLEFPPSRMFYESKSVIETSKVFEFIREMPKGLLLHTHLVSMGSLNYTIKNLTYRDGLHLRQDNKVVNNFVENKLPENNLFEKIRLKTFSRETIS